MIAACPKCNARYRVDPAKLTPEGARLRCTKCEAVFRVRAPADVPVAAPVQAPVPVAPAIEQPPVVRPPESPVDRARTVLVADPDVEQGKRLAAAISSWGLQPLLVHDGVEAILGIQRNLPAAAVIDAALPKMFGFQVCEMVKRNESLSHTKIVLIGAIHHADRYRRPPSDLYGADAYLEQPDLPDGLAPVLERMGLSLESPVAQEAPVPEPIVASPPIPEPMVAPPPIPAPTAPPPIPAPMASPPPVVQEPMAAPLSPPPQAMPAAPSPQPPPVAAPAAPAPATDPRAEERAKAERLARIIVSDIVLYHPEKFEAAVRAGNVAQALGADLLEGRALFVQRIDESVREERDFLMAELERVAAERGK